MITYGFNSQADLQASEILHEASGTSFNVHLHGDDLGRISFRMPGRHNVLNAMAAIAVGLELQVPFDVIAEGFKDFGGVQRRFQIKGEVDDVMVVDDYGHHPVEIKATLAAARDGWDRRVVAVFQPHRYSRTQALYDDFVTAFYQADHVAIMDIYAASEEPIPGVDAASLVEGIAGHGHKSCFYAGSNDATVEHLLEVVRPGDMVITLGAGSIWQTGEEFLARLQERSRHDQG
jgi:UDP-N-acetylmuramate--alanine ligase